MPFGPSRGRLPWLRRALALLLLASVGAASSLPAAQAANSAASGPTPATKARMFFGGFAFAGAASATATRYPHSHALNVPTDDGTPYFSRLAREIVVAEQGRLARGELALGVARDTDTPLVLALAQTEERVLQETIGGSHKLVVTLGFELLLLDFASLEVVSSHPFLIEFIDAGKSPFEGAAIAERIRRMIDGPRSQLRPALVKRLAQVDPTARNRGTLRVDRVLLGPAVPPFLPAAQQAEPESFKEQLAQQFTALLAENAGVAVLPFAKDALNASMALVFADATMLQFKIPPPTFAVEVNLRGFKKVQSEKKPAESLWIYGAFLDLRIVDREFAREYVLEKITETVPKIVPASQATIDDAPVAAEALHKAMLTGIGRLAAHPEFKKSILPLCQN